ncbi:Structural maintenance of chromosomes protein 4 [Exaiptasia diaphana]|nr:Structural maintenance of chromosomes protein 4 [Exaiptasia diaphana]
MAEAMETENSPEQGEEDEMELDCPAAGVGEASRLVISNIIFENFKAYPKFVQFGPFYKSLNSIITYNSGTSDQESDVADAMLFVFGYRSKMIGTRNFSQLIHNSPTYPDFQSCGVHVYFQKIIGEVRMFVEFLLDNLIQSNGMNQILKF